jgi:predicted transglutaminase-like cysteine proteinase
MRRSIQALTLAILLAGFAWQNAAQAFVGGLPRALKGQIERIRFDRPALAPMAFTRFCLEYRDECEIRRMPFRGGTVEMTPKRWDDLQAVNTAVNRSIAPERNNAGILAEKWVISPAAGDCNDYAVTKRHELLSRGWPSHALLLAEVVVPGGEHHLVLVVHAREGDIVLDNLNANLRPWSRSRYQWVRIQSPRNPTFWSTLT